MKKVQKGGRPGLFKLKAGEGGFRPKMGWPNFKWAAFL